MVGREWGKKYSQRTLAVEAAEEEKRAALEKALSIQNELQTKESAWMKKVDDLRQRRDYLRGERDSLKSALDKSKTDLSELEKRYEKEGARWISEKDSLLAELDASKKALDDAKAQLQEGVNSFLHSPDFERVKTREKRKAIAEYKKSSEFKGLNEKAIADFKESSEFKELKEKAIAEYKASPEFAELKAELGFPEFERGFQLYQTGLLKVLPDFDTDQVDLASLLLEEEQQQRGQEDQGQEQAEKGPVDEGPAEQRQQGDEGVDQARDEEVDVVEHPLSLEAVAADEPSAPEVLEAVQP